MSGHGAPKGVDLYYWLGDDPELGLANADMAAYMEAHPCECEALCKCAEREAAGRSGTDG